MPGFAARVLAAAALSTLGFVSFLAAPAPDGTFIAWREHVIDDTERAGEPLLGGDGLAVADLNGDGLPDVVAVHEDSSVVRISFGHATKQGLAWPRSITLSRGKAVGAPEDAAVGDLNGDGKPDIAVACERGHISVFFQVGDPGKPSGWRHITPRLTTGRGSWIRVEIADLDQDGREELLAANKGGTAVSLLDPPEGGTPTDQGWRETVLWQTDTPINARAVDLDEDGDLDVVAASRGERKIVWLESTSSGWVEHLIYAGDSPPSEGFMMCFADLNGDGRLDIVTEEDHGGRVFWLEQRGDSSWVVHLIGTIAPDHATGLALADINGDGRLDLMVGGYSAGPRLYEPSHIKPSDRCGRLAWFEQPGDPRQPWRRHDVSRRRRGMFDMFVPIDVNRDGRVDFLTTRGNSGRLDGLIWLEQVRLTRQGPSFQPARQQDSPEVPLP